MGAPTKIQDHQEAVRWITEGKTYAEIVQLYIDKYNIETTPSMWANVRRKYGIPRRIARNEELIPWAVKIEHRHMYPILMLRKEARRRDGRPLTDEDQHMVDAWIKGMAKHGTVLHYEPDTEQGWIYVPRRPGIDTDLIRKPNRITSKHAAD